MVEGCAQLKGQVYKLAFEDGIKVVYKGKISRVK